MLPDFLRSSYKEYKADSEAVVNWLAATARERGYKIDEVKPPKLKGRARKLARDAVKASESNETSRQGASTKSECFHRKYLISATSLVKFATFITQSTPTIKVPYAVHLKLRKAIDRRKRHRAYHGEAGHGAENEKISEDGHEYFIGALESVWDILEPYFARRPQPEQTIPVVSSGSNCANPFHTLAVEESAEEIITEVAQKTFETTIAPVEFEVKQDAVSTKEETFFAWWCLLKDYSQLRCYLQDLWQKYREGFYDLTVVSVISNTALDFARGIEEEYLSLFSEADIDLLMLTIYCHFCKTTGTSEDHKEEPMDDLNFLAYDALEPRFYPTYLILSQYSRFMCLEKPGAIIALKPEFSAAYDASSDRSTMSNRQKFRNDQIFIFQTLPEFALLSKSPSKAFKSEEDEITRGAREFLETGEVRMWFILGCQVFLDIHHNLRDKTLCGMEDLKRSAAYIRTGVESVLEFHKDLHSECWRKSEDKFLRHIVSYIQSYVERDKLSELRNYVRSVNGGLPEQLPFFLLSRHPLLCGTIAFFIRSWSQSLAIIFANSWNAIKLVAHLYNAVRQEKLLDKPWMDMNLLLSSHDSKSMFIGGYPTSVEDYLKRYLLATGISATAFAKGSRNAFNEGKFTPSKPGMRSLDHICPVSQMIQTRKSSIDGRLVLTPDDIESILKDYKDLGEPFDIIVDEDDWVVINFRWATDSDNDEAGCRPIQLLDSLLNALVSESFDLSFNHFRLHITCWRILQSVKRAVDDDLRQMITVDDFEPENHLPRIVSKIFLVAARQLELAKELRMLKKGDVAASSLFVKVADSMRKFIEVGGDIECQMLSMYLHHQKDAPDIVNVS